MIQRFASLGVLLFLSQWALACESSTVGSPSSGGTASNAGTGGDGQASGGLSPGAGGQVVASGGADAAIGGGANGGGQDSVGGSAANVGGGANEVGGGANGGSANPEGRFELLFRDDFDSLDESRWQLMTHSWDSNVALFSAESVAVQGGELSITLLDAPEGTTDGTNPKQFLGAEVRSVDAITYGRVTARAKLAKGSAVVSSLVTIYTPWPADNWNELDIECLGKDPTQFQSNVMVYTGTLPATDLPVSPTADEGKHSLGADASVEFHEYTIEWTPEYARFLVDGVMVREWATRIQLMNLPQNILLTIWASNVASWAGPVDSTTSGASAIYDWVEVYEYK